MNDPNTFRFLGPKYGQTRASVRRYVEHRRAPNVTCRVVKKASQKHIGKGAIKSTSQFTPPAD